jgi:hypothetical protein
MMKSKNYTLQHTEKKTTYFNNLTLIFQFIYLHKLLNTLNLIEEGERGISMMEMNIVMIMVIMDDDDDAINHLKYCWLIQTYISRNY